MDEATQGIDNFGFIPDSKIDTTAPNIDLLTRNEEDVIESTNVVTFINNEEESEENGGGIDEFTSKCIDKRETVDETVVQIDNNNVHLNNNTKDINDKDFNNHLTLIDRNTKRAEFYQPESNETSIDLSIFENCSNDVSVDKCDDKDYLKEEKLNDANLNNETKVISNGKEDTVHKIDSNSCRSFKKSKKYFWRRKLSLNSLRRKQIQAESKLKQPVPELSRSQYSLVSTGELTPEALQVWKGLPKKIKYDPEMAPFQQRYEKEYGRPETIQLKSKNGSVPESKRLPLVKSAPHLNNNLKVVDDVPGADGKSDVDVLDPKSGAQNGAGRSSSKFALARHYVKMTMLLACWIFFTLVFLMYNEKEHILRNSSINPGEVKNYILNISDSSMSIYVKLSGPFITQQAEARMNASERETYHKMLVWLERWTLDGESGRMVTEADVASKEASDTWTMVLQDDDLLDFSKGEPRSRVLQITSNQTQGNQTSVFALRMKITAAKTSPFTMTYTINPLDMKSGVICACLLLCGLYVLIIFEIINRTMAAVLISTTALATLAVVGERPSLPELVSWLDVETLLLLFSMMLLVAIMAETGMFDFLAVFTFEVTKGKLWPLITLLCIITALLSTFLDNVTTVLLMTPVTIRLCEVMGLDPVPILMSMVLFSNIGGTATPVGDPPNVIIASNRAVVQAGINFTNFTMHMTLGILLVCVQTYFQLRFIYRDANKLRSNEPRDIQDLRHQISIWRRAIESLPHLSKDQHVVRERLERKMRKLTCQMETMIKESHKRVCPKDTFQSTLDELKKKYKIRDKMLLLKSTIAISFVVILFFLHSIPELNRVSLGWTALLGALLLLLLADREDLEPILHRVEWSTLLFFASLFVLMEALSKLGLIEFIGGLTQDLILAVHEKARLAVSLLLMLWVSGVTSAFVDNIPLTTMMVRVVIELGSNPALNLPMAPLIWALSFGACLGGNGTLIGASANVVCAGVAEQHGYRFTFMQFFKVGFPVMIGHLIVASGYLMLCHCVFTWH